MADLRGMLAPALLKVVGEQIGSLIGGKIKLQENLRNDLEKMKMELESVEVLLEETEVRPIKDRPPYLWLKQLKDAMYVMADMIDEFESDTKAMKLSLKNYLAIMIPCLTTGPEITMANKMEKMREDLEVITDQHKKFKFSSHSYTSELKAIDKRQTSSNMEAVIVGRTEDRKKILCSLSESITKELTVLSIYGIGGIGKTTLAKMVYNSSQFKDYCRVWVYVSQTFDLKKIGNSIISQLSKNDSSQTELQVIRNSLSELFAGRKILVVLDDLWEHNESHLDRLKAILKVGMGSKVVVVVTTRVEGIAQKISTIQPHKLEPLTDEMCWSIIKQTSGFESRGEKEYLKQIGKEIAMKCGGVALAAQSLGHMLRSLASSEWESVRDSDMWNVSTSEDTLSTNVLASLRLSYTHMPPYLKLCFAYCAIFPKGHKIVKDDLIHQWISLGFIEPTNVFSFWQLGERYVGQLLGMSFLGYSKSPLTAEVYHEDFTFLTMHDLVHDLARSVMADELLVAGKHGNTGGSCYYYALLNDSSKVLELSKIRALRFMDCSKIELHDAALSSAKSLRVLDLSECSVQNLPDSIGLLNQLRYLNAPRVQQEAIPDTITKLSKLVYLNLHGSSTILSLPESIGELDSLMYLDLSGCSRIKALPESLVHLRKLVHLDLSNCSAVKDVAKILGRLTKLQHLNLSYCSSILCCQEVECLGALTELRYLNLSSKFSFLQKLPEAMCGFTNLSYLNLSGCQYLEELPKLFGNLKNLGHLDLSNCLKVNGVPKALGVLTQLQYLNLSRTCHGFMPRLRGLQDVIGNLRNLRYLNLSRCMSSIFENYSVCPSNFQIDSFMYRISTLPNLEHLELSRNDAISSVPLSLSNLKKERALDHSHCKNLKKICSSSMAICFAVHASDASDGNFSSNLVLVQHMDPDSLNITSLENVTSAEEADSVKLMEKRRLKDLILEWSRDAERYVDDKVLLEKLAPPNTIKKLEIGGYNSVSFPAWLMGQLPNLELLVIRGMESLEEWNISYSSCEDYIIEELEIHDCPKLRMEQLPRAIKLKISKSDNLLSSWGVCTISHNGASSSSSPVTTILQVEYCKVSLHQWKLLHHLPGLTGLSITQCDDLTGSPEIIQCLSSLKILDVAAKDKEELPVWLGELTSLQQLNIVGYPGAVKLLDNMRQLTKLQSLNLYGCSSMASLPHWLGELTSLKTLNILRCDAIFSLPEGIRQLSNLQQLQILFCPLLKQWCESEENLAKLAHIKEKDIL